MSELDEDALPPDGQPSGESSAPQEQAVSTATAQRVEFSDLGDGTEVVGSDKQNLDLFLDVPIPIAVEVGRAQMTLDEILDLGPGSVVRLDKKAEEPIDLRVNGKLVARGEVVMVDDCYGLRVTQILDRAGRIASLH